MPAETIPTTPEPQTEPTPPARQRTEHAYLVALFDRLPPRDQQEILAVAHQRLRLKQLKAVDS